jgi:hypothetical protein
MCLQVLFVAVFPLIIVFVGYGGWGKQANTFKIYFGTLVILAVVLLIVKKVIITPWIANTRIKTGNLEAELEKITHPFGLLSYPILEAADLVKKGLSYDFEETCKFYHTNFHKMDEEYISY